MSSHIDFYNRYIASHAWSCKRDRRLEIDGHECQTCLHDGSLHRLEVHHKTYERLGNEDVERDLITLCAECHEAITNVFRRRKNEAKPVLVKFVKDEVSSRKDVRYGVEDIEVQDHGRRSFDYAQRGSRKPVEQGR